MRRDENRLDEMKKEHITKIVKEKKGEKTRK